MSFTGDEGAYITLTQGNTFTASYRTANPSTVKAHFFGKNKLNEVIAQTGCVGIRMYKALDERGNSQLVLVGVDANGSDITTGLILDRAMPCPSFCDTLSSLNG